ncbi:SDR family NAD(P)-dependent oxidoreductase [Sorangium sp. So ce327]|uniref:SDR family NAD(P)-dependent oxidoreductase n=1 Tax=Sorangium sp. So ce327 TaxID=3133301 RepID=UPI003F5F4848
MSRPLTGAVALVTGASRGVGKGVALGLGEAGATVYVTGRTVAEGEAAIPLPGTIDGTADEVTRLGGRGIAVRCDHRDDEQTRAVIERIRAEQHGRLDVLVNNVWGGYEHFHDGTEFWTEAGFWAAPFSRWDKMFSAGVRAHYVASALSAPLMIARGSGLIVNISFIAAEKDDMGVAYGAAKAACDRMARAMAHELRPHGVAAVSLYPGLVRTEGVMKHASFFGEQLKNSESPTFIGRAVAALAADPGVMQKSGAVLIAAELAREYGFTDVDGAQPRSIREADAGGSAP